MKLTTSLDYSKTNIKGLYILTPNIFTDERGFFYESWNKSTFNTLINEEINFHQDNHSYSKEGVLRGLHYQITPKDQGKLVRCVSGEIFDVAVDIRKNSDTFGKWCGVYLNSENKRLFWIPSGFAHGFLTISNSAEVLYKATKKWDKSKERYLKWNDNDLKIKWPIKRINNRLPKINDKDSNAKTLREIIESRETL